MGQFLRFALLLILAVVGFGSGVCGAIGLTMSLFDQSSGPDNFRGVAIAFSVIGLVIATGCYFLVRLLMRGLQRSATAPAVPPPPPPPGEGPPGAMPPAA